MGSLFKSKTKTTQEPFETNPWAPQQSYLKEGMASASAGLATAQASNDAIPDFVADINPGQTAALDASTNFQNGVLPGANAAVTAGTAAIGGLGAFQGNAAQMVGAAGADRTGQIISNANQFANNPQLQANIDASLGDVRKAFDQDLSGINAMASGTGNINSTRAGTVEALARDDAMDRGAQISAQMRGDAWNKGIDTASMNISDQFSQAGQANAQLGASAAQGVDTLGAGQAMGQGALGQNLANASMTQAQAQAEIDGMRAKGMSDLEISQAYMTAVGGSYGNNGFTSSTKTTPSIFQQVLGGAASVAGAIGGFK